MLPLVPPQVVYSRLRGNEPNRLNWTDDEIKDLDLVHFRRTVCQCRAAGTRAADFADRAAEPDHAAGACAATPRNQSAAAALPPLRRLVRIAASPERHGALSADALLVGAGIRFESASLRHGRA